MDDAHLGNHESVVSFVCTHGIGRQEPGRTAEQVAESVELGVVRLDGFVRQLPPGPAANLAPQLRTRITLPGSPSFVAEFHEAYWDRDVEPPPMRVTLLWLLRVGIPIAASLPGMLMAELETVDDPRQLDSDARSDPCVFLGMAATFLVLPLLLASCLVLGPFALCSRRVRTKMREVVTEWIGDAWHYRSDLLEESVISKISALAHDLRSQSDFVILVGHSQGAELSRRAALEGGVDTCVWVGSGEGPLGLVRTLHRSRLVGAVVILYILAFPMGFAWYAASMARTAASALEATSKAVKSVIDAIADPTHPQHTDTRDIDRMLHAGFAEAGVGVALLAGFIVVTWIVMRMSRHPEDALEQPACEVITVKSLLDPVSFGPAAGHAIVRYVPTRPRRLLIEHTAYFEKPETGLAVLEACVGTAARQSVPLHVPRRSTRVTVASYAAAATCLTSTWAVGTGLMWLITHAW